MKDQALMDQGTAMKTKKKCFKAVELIQEFCDTHNGGNIDKELRRHLRRCRPCRDFIGEVEECFRTHDLNAISGEHYEAFQRVYDRIVKDFNYHSHT
ncbi:MAG: hypothetical protein NC930_01310 [Candidatus Omnitrophica bacterium]|nr:hypothetical protein [Candidatus Omnitrophota bacterium]